MHVDIPWIVPASSLDMLHLYGQQMHGHPQHPVVGMTREEFDAVAADIMDKVVELACPTYLVCTAEK
jgi:hypothetical protein